MTTAQGLLEQAVQHHRSGQFSDAETYYLGAGCLAGNRIVVALPLGTLYLQQERYEEAVEVLESLVEAQPESSQGWLFLGHSRMKISRAAAAAYAYLRAFDLSPGDSSFESAFWLALAAAGGLQTASAEIAGVESGESLAGLYERVIGRDPVITHPIFTRYPPWKGYVPPGFHATAYGSLMRLSFYGAAVLAAGLEVTNESVQGRPPPVNEMYFEWIDLLESIAVAKDRFTMVELGAGFGRWLVAGAVALRSHRNIPCHLVGVEAEDGHFEMLRQHFVDNGLDPGEHKLIKGAVAEKDGEVRFTTGLSEDWWGQAIVSSDAKYAGRPDVKAVAVPCFSIETILQGIELVDLIDMDVQGAEADAVRGSLDALRAKVKRVHIGTHSTVIERDLVKLFTGMGWVCCNNFPCGRTVETHYGPVRFQDGVQTWINPALQQR